MVSFQLDARISRGTLTLRSYPPPGSDMQFTLPPNLGITDTPLNWLLRAFHSKTYISLNYASSQK